MRLNKATTHAIRALVACAGHEADLVKVADLAEELELTQQNAFKIVHLLSRAGFIKATRGRHGGVQLADPATDIRVGEVVRRMEALSFDGGDGEAGSVAAGASLDLIDDAFEAFITVLNQTTIADMARASAKAARSAKSSGRTAAAKKGGKPARKLSKAVKTRETRRVSARA
ncbi:MAG: RrF2 family transcriptional regulator [Hyphomicrobiaceae bacterium]